MNPIAVGSCEASVGEREERKERADRAKGGAKEGASERTESKERKKEMLVSVCTSGTEKGPYRVALPPSASYVFDSPVFFSTSAST